MDNISAYLKVRAFAVGLAMVLAVLYLYFFGFRALVQLELELDSPYPTFFKIYWADEDHGYAEKNMSQVRINPNRKNYSFLFSDLGGLKRLRIDPLDYPGSVNLKRLSINQLGFEKIQLDNGHGSLGMVVIKQAEFAISEKGTVLTTTGKDGQFELQISPQRISLFPIVHVINIGLIFLVVVGLGHKFSFVFKDYAFVPAALMIVLVLATIMAGITGLGVHPDERVHLAGVNYYGENILPPAVDDPAIASSYSGYGYSRLGNYEIYYQLAGYATRMMMPFKLSELLSARLFGLMMLLGLVVYSVKSLPFRIFSLPLLISAQTWYLFSYTNSDAFAIVMVTIASYQIAYQKSALNTLLSQRHYFPWPKVLMLGLFLGTLLLLKSNFYFFLLFVGLYLLWRISVGDFPDQKLLWSRLAIIGMIGLCVYGGRAGLDYAVNGPDPGAIKNQMAEKYAESVYKPSTPLNSKHIYLYLKDRDFSLDRILQKEKWGGKTFLNAFGSYGFTEFLASMSYYDLIKILGVIALAMMLLGLLLFGPPSSQALFALVMFTSVLLIAMLLWRSWTISFQAQGRYLAPILPMLGILYYHTRQFIFERAMIACVLGLFFLGLYSFVFIGLHDIPKTSYLN